MKSQHTKQWYVFIISCSYTQISKTTTIFVLLCLFSLVIHCVETKDEESKAATLLVHKTAPLETIVNQNLTISFTIYNVGQRWEFLYILTSNLSAAYDVKLQDNEWPEENFQIVSGGPKTTFEKIAPGANVTYNYTIIPKTLGSLATTAAVVTFKTQPKDTKQRIVRSTDLPPIAVLTAAEYDKRHDSHYVSFFWMTVLIM